MKIVYIATMMFGNLANAEIVRIEDYSYAFNAVGCDIYQIPKAAQSAIDEALIEANKVCASPKILSTRILSIEPEACNMWNAGFRTKAELEFSCSEMLNKNLLNLKISNLNVGEPCLDQCLESGNEAVDCIHKCKVW